ncbi:MAG: uL30 family ribosomal protein [Candidatus Woesearchaeota archaeon]
MSNKTENHDTDKKLAIIRVRGGIGLSPKVRKTFELLKLYRKNYCSVWPNTPSIIGMAEAVKDYATYGIIDSETYGLLSKKTELKDGKPKGFFRLNPPRGGFGRKGIKKPFKSGGALGDRGDKINQLIKRMLR